MTSRPQHLDDLFREWPYEYGEVAVRVVTGADERQVLQLRVDMGVLQLETTGRPDGSRPGGLPTCFDWLRAEAGEEGNKFVLDEARCLEIDREFVQFFHRRVAWLSLGQFDRAVSDADHTLALMDFSFVHAPDEAWAELHEQYRPFVLFHRTQAAALLALSETGAPAALAQIDVGMAAIRDALARRDLLDMEQEEGMLERLDEMKSAIAQQFEAQPSLSQQLADAVAAEQYELAAQLRDQIRRRRRHDA